MSCDCHDTGSDLASWNADAGRCWNRLRTAVTRQHPELEYFRAAEVQKRGAIHHHVIVWAPDWLDVLELQRLALAAGYGCTIDLREILPGSTKHASYVSKYVSKAVDSRQLVPWLATKLDRITGELTESTAATFRAWSSSQGWGCRMADVRAAARAAVHRRLELAESSSLSPMDSEPARAEAASP